jgi:hypothetical protein
VLPAQKCVFSGAIMKKITVLAGLQLVAAVSIAKAGPAIRWGINN